MLQLEFSLIEDLFKPVVSKIVQQIKDIITEAAKTGESPNKIILAGGFSESPYLYKKIKEAVLTENLFPTDLEYHNDDCNRLIQVDDCGLAVLKGGVHFGLQHGEITFARKARYTYGFDIDEKREAFAKRLLREGREHDLTENDISECGEYVVDVFQVLIRQGEFMNKDQTAKSRGEFVSLEKKTSFAIYEADISNPIFISEKQVRLLKTIELEADIDDSISININFGGTKITAEAWNKTQNNRVEKEFEYGEKEDFETKFVLDCEDSSDREGSSNR